MTKPDRFEMLHQPIGDDARHHFVGVVSTLAAAVASANGASAT